MMAPGKSIGRSPSIASDDDDGEMQILESNDFVKLYEVRLTPDQFCGNVELENDRSDIRRIIVSTVKADTSAAETVCEGDVLIAVGGQFITARTPSGEILSTISKRKKKSEATSFRFWRIEFPSVIHFLSTEIDSKAIQNFRGGGLGITTNQISPTTEQRSQTMLGAEITVHCGRRKIDGTRWGRLHLKIGTLDLMHYFIAIRVGDASESRRQDARSVRRGDILVGIDHEPLPMLITSSDLQYRLSRAGSTANPLTLNLFRVTDPTYRQRILTSCDIVDAGGSYGTDHTGSASNSKAQTDQSTGSLQSAWPSRCRCSESSSFSSACLCIV
uniref:PDZ domain-containing protein n=1 Tax=Aureoumbra lagunensis TaxID=44058 RepID=A0A7S3JVK0_9STRA|mmetsp:Transcript_15888/g.23892  ORF Transcript_15888/g.23892 Transcript_15888/m.23892 type:complete len:330 (-) Transcript_15888:517-1506(-)